MMAGWIVNTCVCLALIYGPWKLWNLDYMTENNCMVEQCYSTWVSALYAGLGRLIWSAGVGWIIFTCVTGFAGTTKISTSYKYFAKITQSFFNTYLTLSNQTNSMLLDRNSFLIKDYLILPKLKNREEKYQILFFQLNI